MHLAYFFLLRLTLLAKQLFIKLIYIAFGADDESGCFTRRIRNTRFPTSFSVRGARSSSVIINSLAQQPEPDASLP